jgi:hypothetical protein
LSLLLRDLAAPLTRDKHRSHMCAIFKHGTISQLLLLASMAKFKEHIEEVHFMQYKLFYSILVGVRVTLTLTPLLRFTLRRTTRYKCDLIDLLNDSVRRKYFVSISLIVYDPCTFPGQKNSLSLNFTNVFLFSADNRPIHTLACFPNVCIPLFATVRSSLRNSCFGLN